MLRFIAPKCFLLNCLLAAVFGVGNLFAEEGVPSPRTLAVLYFTNNSIADQENLQPLSKGLADMFITELSKVKGLKVVERARLQSLLDEMALGQAGVLDETTAQRVGGLLGAKTLLFGGFVHTFDRKIRIDARIVETETGVTLKAEEATDKVGKLLKMIKQLTERVAKDLDVELTKEDKQRLAEAGNESFEAAVAYSKGLDLEDKGSYPEAVAMYQEAARLNPSYQEAKQALGTLNWYAKGLEAQKLGQREEALRFYQKALEARPGYERAKRRIGEIMGKQ